MMDGKSDRSLSFIVGMTATVHESKCVYVTGTIGNPKTRGHLAHETVSHCLPIVYLQKETRLIHVDQYGYTYMYSAHSHMPTTWKSHSKQTNTLTGETQCSLKITKPHNTSMCTYN